MRNEDLDYYEEDEFIRRKSNCTIFLGYTSNIVSSGLRETIRFLVEHKMVCAFILDAKSNQIVNNNCPFAYFLRFICEIRLIVLLQQRVVLKRI